MGLVKKDEQKKVDEKEEEVKEVKEEPEIVKRLKETEDKYLKLEKEMEKKIQQLVVEYTAKQQPLLDERKKMLCVEDGAGEKTGTPALTGFWCKALQNHPAFNDLVREWDEPVLQYLQDMQHSFVDPEDSDKGFNLKLIFAENPYFTNSTLEKEYKTEIENPYCGEQKVLGIKCTQIVWKQGKDVTVEAVAKKVKGGGAKKAKQKKEKEEARPSFFRDFFRDLYPKMELSPDAKEMAMSMQEDEAPYGGEDDDDDEEKDEETLVGQLMQFDFEAGAAVKDDLVPRAIRWYTGEACPDDDDDDDDEEGDEEEDDDDDDDDDDEDSEDDSAPKGKGKGKGKGVAKKKGKSPELKAKEAPKEEASSSDPSANLQ
eukprot:CAMPEP_0203969388 /NCGR_PEP_ID=MMETSP0359-20131031/97431_1 /ASSEMBLY_ACC=CAM_ASM_000338 /TAXON_ID=268821 /ORGANISM="Scrippsiella Hangoei, Strain SHTV-5" /LENGTH=370 /DNA_ID=CAMNT_0050907325 /DNA_START=70 /DNA_END=1180 /DNA_ORIENTATION=-